MMFPPPVSIADCKTKEGDRERDGNVCFHFGLPKQGNTDGGQDREKRDGRNNDRERAN